MAKPTTEPLPTILATDHRRPATACPTDPSPIHGSPPGGEIKPKAKRARIDWATVPVRFIPRPDCPSCSCTCWTHIRSNDNGDGSTSQRVRCCGCGAAYLIVREFE